MQLVIAQSYRHADEREWCEFFAEQRESQIRYSMAAKPGRSVIASAPRHSLVVEPFDNDVGLNRLALARFTVRQGTIAKPE